jgi:hypothetical protein
LTDDVLFSEETLGGYAVLTKNSTSEYTKINPEHLFIAVVLNPKAMASLLAKSEMENIQSQPSW